MTKLWSAIGGKTPRTVSSARMRTVNRSLDCARLRPDRQTSSSVRPLSPRALRVNICPQRHLEEATTGRSIDVDYKWGDCVKLVPDVRSVRGAQGMSHQAMVDIIDGTQLSSLLAGLAASCRQFQRNPRRPGRLSPLFLPEESVLTRLRRARLPTLLPEIKK